MATLNNTQKLQLIKEIGGSIEIATTVSKSVSTTTNTFRSFEGDTFEVSENIMISIKDDMEFQHNVHNEKIVSYIPDTIEEDDTFSQF